MALNHNGAGLTLKAPGSM